jgi:hypothetical protein
MNKKTFILPIAGFIALLFSCSGDSIQSEVASPVQTKAKLYVTVQDASDGKPVKGAELTMQSIESKPKAITSDNGVAVFENVHVGSHAVLVEATNYAKTIIGTSITNERDGDIYIAQDMFASVSLYSLTASFEGYVYHTNKDGKDVPIKGLPIRFQGGFLQDTYETETTTDANGKFTFSNLPAVGSNYQIVTTGTATPIDGKTYGAKSIFSGSSDKALNKNVSIKAGKINLADDGEALFLVKEYNKIVEETEPLVFKFSDKIDANRINSNTVTFSPEVANIVWGDSSVTLNPVGKWKGNAASGEFTVVFNSSLLSAANRPLRGNSSFDINVKQVDLRETPVQGLWHLDSNDIKYTSENTRIIFKKLDGATGYDFYLKEEIEGKMVTEKIDCGVATYTLSKTDTIVSCPVSMDNKNPMNKRMIGFKKNTIIVRASNSRFENEFDKAAKVEIYEHKKPAPDLIWANTPTPICDHYIGGKNGLPLPYYTGAGGANCDDRYHLEYGTGATSRIYFSAVDGSLIIHRSSNIFNSVYGLSRKLGRGTADSVAEGRLFFNRAMDTTKIPTIACEFEVGTEDGNPCHKMGMDFKWINEQNLSVKVKVIAGNPLVGAAKAIDATIKIGNLFALNGTGFASTYNGLVAAPDSLKTVNIRFTGTTLTTCEIDGFDASCNDTQKKTFCENNWDAEPRCGTAFNECELFSLKIRPIKPACRIFQEGFEGGSNQFDIVNDLDLGGNNVWMVGTATPWDGDYSAYISLNGSDYDYNHNSESRSTLRKIVNFPTRTENFSLSFMWKSYGEGGYDYMTVCLVPSSNIGTFSNCYNSSYRVGGGITNNRYQLISNWTLEQINLPAASYSGEYYLMFEWRNDSSVKYGVPAVIDNIILQ